MLTKPPLKIYFVNGGETAVYRPELATKDMIKREWLIYEYVPTEGMPPYRKIGKTVPVTMEQINRLIDHLALKVL